MKVDDMITDFHVKFNRENRCHRNNGSLRHNRYERKSDNL